tara:strand:- start:719 stop:856 length:138 start_codon:yes stop_codon:yes gene_type:complete
MLREIIIIQTTMVLLAALTYGSIQWIANHSLIETDEAPKYAYTIK